jgi:hypothetical protein
MYVKNSWGLLYYSWARTCQDLKVIVGSLTGTPTSHSLLVGGSGSVAEADLSRS